MNQTTPALGNFINHADLAALIERTKAEDLGPDGLDVTSAHLIPTDRGGAASIVARQHGTLAGAALLELIASTYDEAVQVRNVLTEGSALGVGTAVAELSGPVGGLLAIERVALNFLTHLCGIATLTASYVAAVAGTGATICDTRKTLPGLRGLEKYAVACGGGGNHRRGLHDAMLIKDNHLAYLSADRWKTQLRDAIRNARAARPAPAFVEIEVDRIDQLRSTLACKPDFVLLDNMSTQQLRQAVSIRNAEAPAVQLEASGGVTLQTVRQIAETGVDRISVGAITHSAPALDLAMDAL